VGFGLGGGGEWVGGGGGLRIGKVSCGMGGGKGRN
jgi:hypothetical protein